MAVNFIIGLVVAALVFWACWRWVLAPSAREQRPMDEPEQLMAQELLPMPVPTTLPASPPLSLAERVWTEAKPKTPEIWLYTRLERMVRVQATGGVLYIEVTSITEYQQRIECGKSTVTVFVLPDVLAPVALYSVPVEHVGEPSFELVFASTKLGADTRGMVPSDDTLRALIIDLQRAVEVQTD